MQKLIEASNYAEDPEIMGHLGDVYYSLGSWEEAQQQWENALGLWDKSAEEVPSHSKYETARELKAKKIIQNKLSKIRCLKMVESSKEKTAPEERVVASHNSSI